MSHLVFHKKKYLKFGTYVHEYHLEGSVPKILYLGASFCFMKFRNLCLKKRQLLCFLGFFLIHKMKPR